jgi:Lrp/AsnC family transcriptional regulator
MDKSMLDADSRAILRHLQAEPALTVPELAALTRLSAAKVSRRLDRMSEDGVILGQAAIIDWAALGYAVQVSLRITLDKTIARAFDDFLEAARQVREVLEIQTFLGRVDVRLSLVARDLPHYQDIYRNQILTLPHIADIEALMTVASVKSDKRLPL